MSIGDQADGKLLLLHVISFRAALFTIDCVLGRGIKIDPTGFTVLVLYIHSQTIHLRREYGSFGLRDVYCEEVWVAPC